MVDILVHMDPWHIDKSYQCLDDEILVLEMRWFFLIQSYQLSVFCMDDLESMGIYVKLCSSYIFTTQLCSVWFLLVILLKLIILVCHKDNIVWNYFSFMNECFQQIQQKIYIDFIFSKFCYLFLKKSFVNFSIISHWLS